MIFKWKKYRISNIKDKGSQSDGHDNENKSKGIWFFSVFLFVYIMLLSCWLLKENRDLQHVNLQKAIAAL